MMPFSGWAMTVLCCHGYMTGGGQAPGGGGETTTSCGWGEEKRTDRGEEEGSWGREGGEVSSVPFHLLTIRDPPSKSDPASRSSLVHLVQCFHSTCSILIVLQLELLGNNATAIIVNHNTLWCLTFPPFRQQTSLYKLLLCQIWAEELATSL